MNDFDKKLDFDSNTFEDMKHDMNFVLQRLLGNMIEKQSNEGNVDKRGCYDFFISAEAGWSLRECRVFNYIRSEKAVENLQHK